MLSGDSQSGNMPLLNASDGSVSELPDYSAGEGDPLHLEREGAECQLQADLRWVELPSLSHASCGDASGCFAHTAHSAWRAGFAVLPLVPDEKVPLGEALPIRNGKPAWTEYITRRATSCEMQHWAERFAEASYGIIAGLPSRLGKHFLYVLDIESRPLFIEWLDYLTREIGPTLSVLTRRGGHIYLLSSAPVQSQDDPAGRFQVIGQGKYVVGWNCEHPEGGHYVLHTNPGGIAIADSLPFCELRFASIPILEEASLDIAIGMARRAFAKRKRGDFDHPKAASGAARSGPISRNASRCVSLSGGNTATEGALRKQPLHEPTPHEQPPHEEPIVYRPRAGVEDRSRMDAAIINACVNRGITLDTIRQVLAMPCFDSHYLRLLRDKGPAAAERSLQRCFERAHQRGDSPEARVVEERMKHLLRWIHVHLWRGVKALHERDVLLAHVNTCRRAAKLEYFLSERGGAELAGCSARTFGLATQRLVAAGLICRVRRGEGRNASWFRILGAGVYGEDGVAEEGPPTTSGLEAAGHEGASTPEPSQNSEWRWGDIGIDGSQWDEPYEPYEPGVTDSEPDDFKRCAHPPIPSVSPGGNGAILKSSALNSLALNSSALRTQQTGHKSILFAVTDPNTDFQTDVKTDPYAGVFERGKLGKSGRSIWEVLSCCTLEAGMGRSQASTSTSTMDDETVTAGSGFDREACPRGLTQKQIQERAGISTATVSGKLSLMQRLGMVGKQGRRYVAKPVDFQALGQQIGSAHLAAARQARHASDRVRHRHSLNQRKSLPHSAKS